MENIRRYQWHVFGLFCTVTTLVLVLRMTAMIPLYANPELRSKASAIIQATVQREGWLNSGLTVRHISNDSAVLLYRSYIRGRDPVQCYIILFSDGSLNACQ